MIIRNNNNNYYYYSNKNKSAMERGRSARLLLKELGDLAGTWSAQNRNELRLF